MINDDLSKLPEHNLIIQAMMKPLVKAPEVKPPKEPEAGAGFDFSGVKEDPRWHESPKKEIKRK